MDRDAQIDAIEQTFDDVKETMEEHYSKKGIHPVEVIPILPDFDLWKFPCAQVTTFLTLFLNLQWPIYVERLKSNLLVRWTVPI